MIIQPGHEAIPIYRQCELLDLSRSSYYYRPARASAYNELLMRLIDEQYTRTPFYGSPKLTACLRRQGHAVNHKRVERLMRQMGLQAIYPKRNTSKPDNTHRKYPYLLRDMEVVHPDQVWATDITYIRLRQGFLYLVAVMDWFSRYVLAWELSNTLDTWFCLQALDRALEKSKPDIFNSDQGSQFTSDDFTARLLESNVRISMDGRGRCFDNIFVERLWRTVKYEDVYLNDYESAGETRRGLGDYFEFYNCERPHQSLDYLTPQEVYDEF